MGPSDILITNKTALITGGAAGIGQGIALAMAQFGANVIIADINDETGKATEQMIRSNGGQAVYISADITDEDSISNAIDQTVNTFGKLDILINNAGGTRQVNFLNQSSRSRSKHISLNFNGFLNASFSAAQQMIKQGHGGCIINISSIEGCRAAPGYSVYAACKAAMNNFTKSFALEMAEHNIRVNALTPDIIITEGIKAQAPESMSSKMMDARKRYIPIGRDGTPDDCAKAAIFLASPLSEYLTGIILPVDGGTSASSGWIREADNKFTLFPN